MKLNKIILIGIMGLTTSLAVANTRVEMKTSMGTIELALYDKKSPITVANFLKYIKNGAYNGTIFHRVIPNFMIQGGGFDDKMQKTPSGEPIKNEADNGLKNVIGTIAMARTSDPNSASNQFFINVNNNDFLDHRDNSVNGWGYAVFGKVIKGMDVVNKISHVKTGSVKGTLLNYDDVPLKPVKIISVTILPNKSVKK